MKKIFFLILFTSLKGFAFEPVIDHDSRTVFYAPKPTLQVTVYDLGRDGGVLLISSEYESQRVLEQYRELERRYQGFEIKRVSIEATGPFEVTLAPVGLTEIRPTLPNELGPYFNAEFSLSRNEFEKVKRGLVSSPVGEVVRVRAPVKSEVTLTRVIEEAELPAETCERFTVRNVEDLVLVMGNQAWLPRVRLRSTADNLKRDVLQRCFDLNQRGPIRSFHELMVASISVLRNDRPLIGRTVENEKRKIEEMQVFHEKINSI